MVSKKNIAHLKALRQGGSRKEPVNKNGEYFGSAKPQTVDEPEERKNHDQSIIRVEHSKEKPYVQISRKMIEDTSLDLDAKGLLLVLLAKPDDWHVRPLQLAKEMKVGKTQIYRILNKLIGSKYIHREILKRKDQTGRFQTASIYIVFEDREHRREWIDRGRFNYEHRRQ